jgi:hypothetical protein
MSDLFMAEARRSLAGASYSRSLTEIVSSLGGLLPGLRTQMNQRALERVMSVDAD